MVIGERFAWGHLGKTGGDSTLEMFRVVGNVILYADPQESPEKHDTFVQKEKKTGLDLTNGKERILNIRRLPSWVMSFVTFQNQNYQVPINKELILKGRIWNEARSWLKEGTPSYVMAFFELWIDDFLRSYESDKVTHWLRVERLAEDFIRVISNFTVIGEDQKARIRQIRRNVNDKYDRRIEAWFSPEELTGLYEHCPLWASVEKKVYGNLLV